MMGSFIRPIDVPRLAQGVPRIQAYAALVVSPFFHSIEQYSDSFVRSLVKRHHSALKNWPWPLDPLHTWSRQWEYPFSISHLVRWTREQTISDQPMLLDLGSGLSFMPSFFYRLGWQVTCCDNDSRLLSVFDQFGLDQYCHLDLMDFLSTDYKDCMYNALLSVSVLEHLPDQERQRCLSEMHRILQPGGLLVLTFDISLDRESDLSISRTLDLLHFLSKLFASDLANIESDVASLNKVPDDYVTTDWIQRTAPHLLPWKTSLRHFLKSILLLHWPRAPFRSLSVCCLALQKS